MVVNIATSGRPDLLGHTLNSLGECQLPAGYKETVVIENGTRAGLEEVVRSARAQLNARYMHVAQGNKSAALNAALETVGDCLVFFTDDDVRLAPLTLRAYAEAAQRCGARHFFGGPASAEYDVPPPQWLREFLPFSAIGWERSPDAHDANDQPGKSAKFLGFNWAAFAGDLRAAGGFNPDFGPGSPTGSTGQETEMQRRLLSRGLIAVYVPQARVWHYVPKDRCTPAWALERIYRNGIQDGLFARPGNSKFSILPPWWITSRYLKGILKAWMWSLSSRPERRFKAKYRRRYDCGLVHGIRSKSKD
ncbi:MAG: glycosyltransferase [Tepidisphaeraceae bacterium]|jgi:GT2 family glycosyltransferase